MKIWMLISRNKPGFGLAWSRHILLGWITVEHTLLDRARSKLIFCLFFGRYLPRARLNFSRARWKHTWNTVEHTDCAVVTRSHIFQVLTEIGNQDSRKVKKK